MSAIRHDDIAAQRALVEEIRSQPFTGTRRILPWIRRPRPTPPAPLLMLFDFLPEQRRPPRPWEQPPANEAALPPAPWALTPEETAEVEALVVGRYKGDSETRASCRRWDAWIADGQLPENEILQLPGDNASGHVEVLETRLGWAAKVMYATTKKSLSHGRPIRPDFDDGGLFFWATREAAVQYAAYRAWISSQAYRWRPDRVRRSWERFADEMREFFARCGIDATEPPAPETKRVLMTSQRERELGKVAEAEKATAKAAAAAEPDDGVPGDNRLGRYLFQIGAIHPPSQLALKRRRLKEERAAAARAAAEAETAQPLTAEEAAAVEHLAWGKAHSVPGEPHRKAWEAFIAEGAILTEIPVPMRHGHFAKSRITETRLGFTAGYDYEHPKAGSGGGGYLDPQHDDEGWFLWSTRQAALQAAANELWTEYCEPVGKDVIRQHFASIGIDVEDMPGEDDKRLLVSHSIMADLYNRKLPRVPEQSLDALVEYERACGLTDHWAGLDKG